MSSPTDLDLIDQLTERYADARCTGTFKGDCHEEALDVPVERWCDWCLVKIATRRFAERKRRATTHAR